MCIFSNTKLGKYKTASKLPCWNLDAGMGLRTFAVRNEQDLCLVVLSFGRLLHKHHTNT